MGQPVQVYEEKKRLHRQLINQERLQWNTSPRHLVFILVYNAAERVKVGQTFNELCLKNKIRGATAHLSQGTVCQWKLKLLLAAAGAEIFDLRRKDYS